VRQTASAVAQEEDVKTRMMSWWLFLSSSRPKSRCSRRKWPSSAGSRYSSAHGPRSKEGRRLHHAGVVYSRADLRAHSYWKLAAEKPYRSDDGRGPQKAWRWSLILRNFEQEDGGGRRTGTAGPTGLASLSRGLGYDSHKYHFSANTCGNMTIDKVPYMAYTHRTNTSSPRHRSDRDANTVQHAVTRTLDTPLPPLFAELRSTFISAAGRPRTAQRSWRITTTSLCFT